MEVRIGVQHATRELVIESDRDPGGVFAAVEAGAGRRDRLLTLDDESGRQVVVPADKLAYVEIGEPRDPPGRLRLALWGESEGAAFAIRPAWFSVSRANIRPTSARSAPRCDHPADEQGRQRVALGGDPLRLAQRLAPPAGGPTEPAGRRAGGPPRSRPAR